MNQFRMTETCETLGAALAEAQLEANARGEKIVSFKINEIKTVLPDDRLTPLPAVFGIKYQIVYLVELNLDFQTPNQTAIMIDAMHERRKELLGDDYDTISRYWVG